LIFFIFIFLFSPLLFLLFLLEYCVHVSKTTAIHRKDLLHRDKHDISPAFVFYFGDFSGAELVCFDDDGETELAILGEPFHMGIFDPRLPHMVRRSKNFQGSRYCVIFFKMWDHSAVLAPFEKHPRYLEDKISFSFNEAKLDGTKSFAESPSSSKESFSFLQKSVHHFHREGMKLFFTISSKR